MSDVSGQSKAAVALDRSFESSSPVSADDVRSYLVQNPDFFLQHPELLEQLSVPHEQKGSVSLVELQGEQLRKKVRQLNYKLSQLIAIAKQNEKLFRVYADLNVRLLSCRDVADVQLMLEEVMQESLSLASVVIKPFKGPLCLPELQRRLFMEKRFKQSPFFFGRLSQHEKQLLFGDQIAESAALILVGKPQSLAIVAVGSANAGHFTPDMDTLLLQQLQQVLNIVLPPMLDY